MPGTLSNEAAGEQALEHLRSTTPPEWLAPNLELSETARVASEYLFSRLKPYAIKCPFDRLLTDGFDAEQIWQQIDLQTQPLLSTLRREIKKFERNPKEIRKLWSIGRGEEDETVAEEEGEKEEEKKEKDNDFDGDYGDDLDLDDIEGFEEDDDDEEEEEDGGEIKEEGNEEREGVVEDKFLKINELEKFLKEDEAREYGFKSNEKKHRKEDEEEEDDDDDEEEEDNYEEVNL